VYFTLVLVVAHLFSFIIMSRVNNNDRLPGAAAFRTGQSSGRRPLSFSMSERVSNASRAVHKTSFLSLSVSLSCRRPFARRLSSTARHKS
jgi:hypothetical protein